MVKREIGSKKQLPEDLEVEITPVSDKVTSKIKLKAPKQKDGKTVYYTVGEFVEISTLVDPGGFNPGRSIGNIILDKDTDIAPPILVSVEITPEDVQRAAGATFKLAYHDGSQWVVVKKDIASQAGFTTFELSKRGDPAMGVSP